MKLPAIVQQLGLMVGMISPNVQAAQTPTVSSAVEQTTSKAEQHPNLYGFTTSKEGVSLAEQDGMRAITSSPEFNKLFQGRHAEFATRETQPELAGIMSKLRGRADEVLPKLGMSPDNPPIIIVVDDPKIYAAVHPVSAQNILKTDFL